MKIDTEGTYTLRYTAEDECGNVTTEDRSVVVQNITYSTVLFTDGTFIINEKSTDRAANVALHGAVTIEYAPFDPNGATDRAKYIFEGENQVPWDVDAASIFSVEVGSPIQPFSMAYWFSGCSVTTDIDLSPIDTSQVTSMKDLFSSCYQLSSLNISNFDTRNVTDMSGMFATCKKLTNLDLSHFDTSKVTTMSKMFINCTATLDLSSFDTSNVTEMSWMFQINNVTPTRASLDISSFDTSSVTTMLAMFYGNSAMTTIYASDRFVTNQVTNSYGIFTDCYALVGGAGTAYAYAHRDKKAYARIDNPPTAPGFFTNLTYSTVLFTDGTFIINEKSTDRTANIALHGAVTNEYIPFNPNGSTDAEKYIFSDVPQRPWHSQATSIKAVEIGSNIQPTSTAYWFYLFVRCTSMDLDNLDTSAVTNMNNMFNNCQALTSLDVSSFDTSAVTNMSNMFNNCQALISLDVTHFDTSAVTDMSNMFYYCRALQSLDVTHFDTSAVANMSYMFYECYALASLDVSRFNTSAVTNMRDMFQDCRLLTTLDLSNFNTSLVTNMREMFQDCTSLTTIYASATFVVTQVTISTNMFTSMSTNLIGGAGTTWSSSNPTDKTYAHIDGGTSNPGYFTAKS